MSMSSSHSSSQSYPTPTHENDLIDQLSGVAAGLANQMHSWAQGVFAQTSQVTNQAVGNFFQVSQKMLGLSNNMTDQYNNLFAPQNAQLVAEANSYASPARMKVNMGMAGATQAQAGDAALRNSEEALRSYGINPSDGRYAALDKAAEVQNAANVAGAENMQRNSDIATGQRLRSEAVQVGAQLPAAIANVNNTAIQANAGASNASLANANTGANLMRLPNEYLKTAMDVKLPPMGQTSNSQSQSGPGSGQHATFGPSDRGGGGGGGMPGGGFNSGGGGGPAWMPHHGDGGGGGGSAGGRGGGYNHGPGSQIFQNYDRTGLGNYNDFSDPTGQNYDPMSGIDPNSFNGAGGQDYLQPEQGYSMGVGQPSLNDPFNDYGGGGSSWGQDSGAGGFGQTYDYGGPDQTYTGGSGGSNTEWGNINYDTAGNNYDPGWGQTYDQPNPNTDWGNGASAYNGYGGGFGSMGGGDTSNPNSSFYAGDYTMPSDNYDMGGAYAKGGPIPPSMSPSGGRQVDDIPAQGPGGAQLRMNANEFVIPQDVALWKGQEFFQKLIDQSRKLRTTAPAQPQRMQPGQPPRGNPPTGNMR